MRRWICASLLCAASSLPAADLDIDELTEDLLGPGQGRMQELVMRLDIGDVPLRAQAAWELAQTQHEKAAGPLLAALQCQPPPELVPHLVIALGWLGEKSGPNEAEHLAPLLQSESAFTRTAVLWALGCLKVATAADAMRARMAATDADELERFLAREALTRLDGGELLADTALKRPLKAATILHVSGMDADATAFLFRESARDVDLHFDAVTAGPWNPTMGKLGGLGKPAQQYFAERLAFDEEGRPLTDLVFISSLYPHEFPYELRWRLWNYVRRGGKLILGSLALQPVDVNHLNVRSSRTILHVDWRPSCFDSLLPVCIERGVGTFLKGTSPASQNILFGESPFGRGAVTVVGFPCTTGDAAVLTVDQLIRRANDTWRHLVLQWGVGVPEADDPVLWRHLFAWVLGGDAELAAVREHAPFQETAPEAVLPFQIALDGPATFDGAATNVALRIAVRGRDSALPADAILTAEVQDIEDRTLRRRTLKLNTVAGGAHSADAAFDLSVLPAGGYWWSVQLRAGDVLLGDARRFLARMEPWRFRASLVVLQWASYLPLPPEGMAAVRSIGLSVPSRPPEDGLWTWTIYSPPFLPRGAWPADILGGAEGDEWRAVGLEFGRHPYFTCLDTVEESDLKISTQVVSVGDVEKEGHEQYRIYLKRKYRSIDALNQAWGAAISDWSEISLLGGQRLPGDHMTYTGRIGGTGGNLVDVPAEPDAASGFGTLQPYLDQNAWRWNYLWEMLEIRRFAFHQTDPFHPVHPGGHMGLSAPFDVPHSRLYANNSLSAVGFRATLGRETYGLTPHVVLIGLTGDAAANSRLIWSALANGARIITIYAPGDRYGVELLKGDYTLTDAALTLKPILGRIMPVRGVLLDTRNVVDRRVLFYSGGTNPYRSPLRPELYEALVAGGTLPDYGTDLFERTVVLCGSADLDAEHQQRLRAFAESGGTLVLLAGVDPELLMSLGTGLAADVTVDTTPRRVTVDAKLIPDTSSDPLRFASVARRAVKADAAWSVVGRYDDGVPAVLSRSIGAGRVWLLNLDYRYSATLDLASEATTINEDNEALRQRAAGMLEQRYAPGGSVRRDAEAFRVLLARILDQSDATGACRAIDADGTTMPYVEALLLETRNGSQRYVAVYADHRLPKGVDRARGCIEIGLPGVVAVYDGVDGRSVALRDGVFPFDLAAGEGTVLALLTEADTALDIVPDTEHAQPETPLRLGLRIARSGGGLSTCEHALDLRVYDTAGDEIEGLHQRLSVRGAGIAVLHPAWNDPPGEWHITVRDLTTGGAAEARVILGDVPGAGAETSRLAAAAWHPPSVSVVCGSLQAPAQVNVAPLTLRVRGAQVGNARLRVRLNLPDRCLLAGEAERIIELTDDVPEAVVTWDLFLSRPDAVALYYSQLPPVFAVDRFRPETQRLQGRNLPAVEMALLDGDVEQWTWNGESVAVTNGTLTHPVAVDLIPFAARPLEVGALRAEPIGIDVYNGTARELAGEMRIAPPDVWRVAEGRQAFRVAPGGTATARFFPDVPQDRVAAFQANPCLMDVPIDVRLGRAWLDAGPLRVEHTLQREWLAARGEAFAPVAGTDTDVAPMPPPGSRRVIGDTRVPLESLLRNSGERAHAWSWVMSDYTGPVTVQTTPVGANVRVWLNGSLVHQGGMAVQSGTETDNVLKTLAAILRPGRNTIAVEALRMGRRYLDPTLTILDKSGVPIRGLVFRVELPATRGVKE